MDGYISKPVRRRELLDLVEKHGRRRTISGVVPGGAIAI
jgi:DNA-binding response OmpR family regulator